MLDVPRELVLELARLLRAERRARGTRKGTRLLTCFRQALLVLVWMRTKGDVAVIGAGFSVPRATAYRYRDEGIKVLAAQAPDLHEALQEVAEQGWSHVVVDGKLIRTDRCAETTTSVKGETINVWYSGKHRAPGGNVQAVIRPDGVPIFVSDVAPGHLHDLTVARHTGVIGALHWAASQLDLPTLADSGYEGAGQGIKTPIKQPVDGQVLAPDNQAYNALLRSNRCLGERGFALLTGRWRALQRVTVSPRRIGDLAQAALVLTRIENVQLRTSC
ncbi:MAG TPA: transposase family protein [Kineosporiaceae bacterium]|nr:transposase family protein [Kineosporiaceae bacterium]